MIFSDPDKALNTIDYIKDNDLTFVFPEISLELNNGDVLIIKNIKTGKEEHFILQKQKPKYDSFEILDKEPYQDVEGIENETDTASSAMVSDLFEIFNSHEIEKGDFDDMKMLVDLLDLKEGNSVLNIGGGYLNVIGKLGFLLSRKGFNYTGFNLTPGFYDISERFLETYVKDSKYNDLFPGLITNVKGEFSSGPNSVSQNIPDHSQDVVIGLTGVYSDPRPESDAMEVLEESLRVIKIRG